MGLGLIIGRRLMGRGRRHNGLRVVGRRQARLARHADRGVKADRRLLVR